jgi:hypothetical protein
VHDAVMILKLDRDQTVNGYLIGQVTVHRRSNVADLHRVMQSHLSLDVLDTNRALRVCSIGY